MHLEAWRESQKPRILPYTVGDYLFSEAALPLLLSTFTSLGPFWRIVRRDGSEMHGRSAPLGAGAVQSPVDVRPSCRDDDVLAEEQRVASLLSPGCADLQDEIVYHDLHHTYPVKGSAPVHAVRGISLGIRRGECFGLLGPNGAGKTTTLAILTGELWPPSAGRVLVGSQDVAQAGFGVLYGRLGNCPQEDPLWPDLSGREHLLFYGRVKGVPEAALRREVEILLRQLGLGGNDASKRCKEYSGGMRRKL